MSSKTKKVIRFFAGINALKLLSHITALVLAFSFIGICGLVVRADCNTTCCCNGTGDTPADNGRPVLSGCCCDDDSNPCVLTRTPYSDNRLSLLPTEPEAGKIARQLSPAPAVDFIRPLDFIGAPAVQRLLNIPMARTGPIFLLILSILR